MSVCEPLCLSEPVPLDVPIAAPPTISEYVHVVLGDSPVRRAVCERRREQRHPYPYPVRLIPVIGSRTDLVNEPIAVVGKHLAVHGLDFYSSEPISFRRAIACFECRHGREVRLLMDLTWCRFCRHGWYENGGRFLQAVLT